MDGMHLRIKEPMNINKMKRLALVISLFSLLTAFLVNQINSSEIKADGLELRQNTTVITADDVSYLSPGENWIKKGEIANNDKSINRYFLRPPGYPVFYGVNLFLFGKENALTGLTTIQFILFGVSIYCLFFLSYHLFGSKTLAIITTLAYGASGISIGFLNYTLTEGITPQLVIFFYYFLFKGHNSSKKAQWRYFLTSSLLFAILFITRPVLGIFILPLVHLIIDTYKHQIQTLVKRLIIVITVAFLPMIIWQVRNASIAGEYVGLHPVYFSDNVETIFRPPHQAMYAFFKGWGETGEQYHSYTVPMWKSAMDLDSSEHYPNQILRTIPSHVKKHFGQKRLLESIQLYQKAMLQQAPYFHHQKSITESGIPLEKEATEVFRELNREFKANFPFEYHIESPAKVFKELSWHSNLSLYVYQKTWRGTWLMELNRFVAFVLHFGSFSLIIFASFFFRKHKKALSISIPVIIYIFYLCYFQRGIEERYTLPILAVSITVALGMIYKISNRILKK